MRGEVEASAARTSVRDGAATAGTRRTATARCRSLFHILAAFFGCYAMLCVCGEREKERERERERERDREREGRGTEKKLKRKSGRRSWTKRRTVV